MSDISSERVEQIVHEFMNVLQQQTGGVLFNLSANAGLLTAWLEARKLELTSENLLAASAALEDSLVWQTRPNIGGSASPAYEYPPTPPFMDRIRTKADIASLGPKYSEWMRSKHKKAFIDRVNFILQNNISRDGEEN